MKKLSVLFLYSAFALTLVHGQTSGPASDKSEPATAGSAPKKTVQLDWTAELKGIQGELARKPDSAFLHSQAATAYNELGDFPAFNREIHLSMHLDKQRAIYYYMAYAVYKQRHLKELQIQTIDRALKVDPDNPFGHYERAAIFEDDSKWADALAEYEVTQKMLERVAPTPDSRSYSKWTYFDQRGDPYDMTIEKANIDQDVSRVRAKLTTSK